MPVMARSVGIPAQQPEGAVVQRCVFGDGKSPYQPRARCQPNAFSNASGSPAPDELDLLGRWWGPARSPSRDPSHAGAGRSRATTGCRWPPWPPCRGRRAPARRRWPGMRRAASRSRRSEASAMPARSRRTWAEKSTTWATTSEAVHPAQGDGDVHRPGGVPATSRSKRSAPAVLGCGFGHRSGSPSVSRPTTRSAIASVARRGPPSLGPDRWSPRPGRQ